MKKIKIIYLPGLAGNFLEFLFSLDPKTEPCISLGSNNDTPQNRIRCCIEKLQELKKINHWGDLGDKQINGDKRSNIDYPTIVRSIHPLQLSFDDFESAHFLVDLSWSNFANYWLIKSREILNYQLARMSTDEIDKQIRVKKKYNPTIISLDSFLDSSSWMDEYVRVSQLMGLSYYPEAQELYQRWFDFRVSPIKKMFDESDQQTVVTMCRKRLEENTYGAPSDWNIFYENIRDPSWPNCRVESEFNQLPANIQQEIINKFDYTPLTSKN